ncbi:MAG: hypothetical protein AAGF73_00390 [Actinomycetota bacterium]
MSFQRLPRRHLATRRALPVSRRTLILGTVAGGLVAACTGSSGGGNDEAADDTSSIDGDDFEPFNEPGADGFTLVQRFPQGVQVPGELRLPLSLSTGAAQLIQDGPDTLTAQVTDLGGNPLGEPITATRRDVAPAPYYDFRPTIAEPGFYALVVDGGPEGGANFDVADPSTVPVPIPGQMLPGFDTPTFDDDRGVDPICTREPEPCPFHELTLTEALAAGRPVAYLVGTPAFCSTGTCAPALDAMVTVAPAYDGSVSFVHAEVYTDDTATTLTPAIEAIGMFYEPALFVTDATGVLVERLDAVWDETELVDALDRVTA